MRLEDATVLVVDDEPDLREIYSAWLEKEGCKVFTAGNGVEALQVFDEHSINALVSDIRMPRLDGIALVRTIYERKLIVPTIILVSGFGVVGSREMYGLGIEELMDKPLRRKDLISILKQSLQEMEQNWLTPSTEPMAQSLAMEMASLEGAMQSCQFQLGRGGCCFSCNQILIPEKTTSLSIRFAKEELCLEAQGRVRWYDEETSHAGLAFDYLAAGCRNWVLEAMRQGSHRSFIPQCGPCS